MHVETVKLLNQSFLPDLILQLFVVLASMFKQYIFWELQIINYTSQEYLKESAL